MTEGFEGWRRSMSTQADNKRLMRRFTEEFWNRGNIAFADAIVAEDLIHDQLPPDWPQGREGFKRLVQTWRVAFPDLHEHLEFVLAEGDRALGRFRLTGTHSGPFYGIEPTGRSVDIHGVDVARIVDGQIVEYFYHEDTFGLIPPAR
jgi:predicted ester cyclase